MRTPKLGMSVEREKLSDPLRNEIVQRITRNFLDILILKFIQTEPSWGYKIKKVMEKRFGVKVRHGALYPMLNTLEASGFIRSRKEVARGRTRKVYEITSKGIHYLRVYNEFLKEQF